ASCGAPSPGGEGRCAACAAGPARPSTASLYRLAGFARARARLIALGFLLTLAGTIAGLVPPYLTMPLLDRVLIPHQNGLPVDFSLVWWYLGGLAGSALLAWCLDWGRGYVPGPARGGFRADLAAPAYAPPHRLFPRCLRGLV